MDITPTAESSESQEPPSTVDNQETTDETSAPSQDTGECDNQSEDVPADLMKDINDFCNAASGGGDALQDATPPKSPVVEPVPETSEAHLEELESVEPLSEPQPVDTSADPQEDSTDQAPVEEQSVSLEEALSYNTPNEPEGDAPSESVSLQDVTAGDDNAEPEVSPTDETPAEAPVEDALAEPDSAPAESVSLEEALSFSASADPDHAEEEATAENAPVTASDESEPMETSQDATASGGVENVQPVTIAPEEPEEQTDAPVSQNEASPLPFVIGAPQTITDSEMTEMESTPTQLTVIEPESGASDVGGTEDSTEPSNKVSI